MEEQEGLAAAARQRQPLQQRHPAQAARIPSTPVLAPWQLGTPAAAGGGPQLAGLAGRQQPAASQPGSEGGVVGGAGAAGTAGAPLRYAAYVEQAMGLLGVDGEPAPLLCVAHCWVRSAVQCSSSQTPGLSAGRLLIW